MIVILCDSWEMANDSYGLFMDFLEKHDSFGMWTSYDCSCCVRLESLFLCPPLPRTYYIFVPYQVQNYDSLKFDVAQNEIVDCGTFFDELYQMEEEMLNGELN